MTILDLIEQDGFDLHKAASTGGGEWAGACPWCGGKDRFRVWPGSARYWCRSCGAKGDAIQYLRDRRGLSFVEACRVIGRDPGGRLSEPRPAPATWEPKEASRPGEVWQQKARAFLDEAVQTLWTGRGTETRGWLHEQKGLSDATIKAAGLGFNPADIFEPRQTWGLEPSIKEDGTERRQWIPAGLVIPWVVNGHVSRLRIRRNNPGDGARYVVVSGSSMAPAAWNLERAAVVIVESELDGLLLSQEAGDLCAVVVMGTATAKPDTATHKALKAAAAVLVALDTDEAGAKAAWQFWPDTYGATVRRWPCVLGKDPSEAQLNGLDLREWIIAGMFESEEQFERFAIQTVDGGLKDIEALKAMTAGVGSIFQSH